MGVCLAESWARAGVCVGCDMGGVCGVLVGLGVACVVVRGSTSAGGTFTHKGGDGVGRLSGRSTGGPPRRQGCAAGSCSWSAGLCGAGDGERGRLALGG
eukprot:5891042-Ditylum_brightwellii.AAC.1